MPHPSATIRNNKTEQGVTLIKVTPGALSVTLYNVTLGTKMGPNHRLQKTSLFHYLFFVVGGEMPQKQ